MKLAKDPFCPPLAEVAGSPLWRSRLCRTEVAADSIPAAQWLRDSSEKPGEALGVQALCRTCSG